MTSLDLALIYHDCAKERRQKFIKERRWTQRFFGNVEKTAQEIEQSLTWQEEVSGLIISNLVIFTILYDLSR